jgi:molecular chaperone GrpE
MENDHKVENSHDHHEKGHTEGGKCECEHRQAHDKKEKECKDCRKLREEILHLKDSVEKLKTENAALDDSYRRKVADFDNYRKRMLKQVEESSVEAGKKIVSKIVPIVDNFSRAIRNSEVNKDFNSLYEGLKITNSDINKLFDDLGVKPIDAVGKEFDPNLHEALMMEEREDVPFDKTVVEELEKGYTIGDSVIRHSKVKVAKKVEKQG